jgi:hypothetical protein
LKLSQVELIKVEPAIQLWIGSEQNLKATIKDEAVDVVGTNSATHFVGGLKELNANTGGSQGAGTGQSSQASSNDYDVFVHAFEDTDCELPSR